MGKLLTILGVNEQSNLTDDIFTAEELIVGMQYIYQNAEESPKKDKLAKAIAESVRLLLQQVRGLPLTPPAKEETTSTTFKVGDIFTVPEEDVIEFYKIVTIDESNVVIENLDTKTKDIRVNKVEFESEFKQGLYNKCNQFSVGDKVKSKYGDVEFTIKDVTLNLPRTYVMYQLDSGEHIYSYDVATNFEQYKPSFKVGDVFNAHKDIMHEDWVIKSINDSSITQEVIVEWGKDKGKKETRYVGYEADLLVRSGKWVKKGEKEEEKENNSEFYTLGGEYSETTLIKGAWYMIDGGNYVGRFTEGEPILESDGTYNYSRILFNEIFSNTQSQLKYFKGRTKSLEEGSFANDQMISRAILLTDTEVLDVFKNYFDEQDIYKNNGIVDNTNILGSEGVKDDYIQDQNFKLRFSAKRGKQQILVSGIVVYEEGEGFANYQQPRETKKPKKESGTGNVSFDRWYRAVKLYGDSYTSGEQESELSELFNGRKITARFIVRSVKVAQQNFFYYNEDVKEFGQENIDNLVNEVLGIFESEKPKTKGSRPSPTTSANSVAEGTQLKGNDGKMYIAKKTAKGYNQWKLFK